MAKRKADEETNEHVITDAAVHAVKKRKANKTPGEKFIDAANDLSADDFQEAYVPKELLTHAARPSNQGNSGSHETESLEISFRRVDQLNPTQLNSCLDLIASTSQKDYENSTIGWHPRRKKREMREDQMRYLLIQHSSNKTATTSPAQAKEDREDSSILAFLSFMLTHDSTPSVPVLYLYEIHLQPHLQKRGLGAHLMRLAESIAWKVGVRKIMLTCFVSNLRARKFYQGRGYAIDASSPEARTIRTKVVEPDYVILSKGCCQGEVND